TANRDVMTAWTLGPEDKAEVVARFLLELGKWDVRKRPEVGGKVEKYQRGFRDIHQQAEDRLLQAALAKEVKAAREEMAEIARSVGQFVLEANSGFALDTPRLGRLREQLERRKQKNAELAKEVARLAKPDDLPRELGELNSQVENM